MRQLEDSIEFLNGRLRSSRRLQSHVEPQGRSHTVDTQRSVGRTGGTPRKEGYSFPTIQHSRPSRRLQRTAHPQRANVASQDSRGRWKRGSKTLGGFVKHRDSDSRVGRNGGDVGCRSGCTLDRAVVQWEPATSLPSPQDAHKLWTSIITAGMVATFGSAEASSARWGAIAPAQSKNGLGRKLGL